MAIDKNHFLVVPRYDIKVGLGELAPYNAVGRLYIPVVVLVDLNSLVSELLPLHFYNIKAGAVLN